MSASASPIEEVNEHILEQSLDPSKIIVINPGSLYLKIGRASDPLPLLLPHVIARRNRNLEGKLHEDLYLLGINRAGREKQQILLNAEQTIMHDLSLLDPCRFISFKLKCCEFNKKSKAVIMPKSDGAYWKAAKPEEDTLIGKDALLLHPSEPFHIHWPFRRGKLNLHSGIGGSLRSVLSDICTIWTRVIVNQLQINLEDIDSYKVVLIIPDVYNRAHIKEIINLLLNDIGFGHVLIHHESVCATFGAGLTFATVVDIGDQKTSISCVEDGSSLVNARLTLEYGGNDITSIFYHLLNCRNFPYVDCNPRTRVGAILIQQLKESFCYLEPKNRGPQERYFFVNLPNSSTYRYDILLGEECILAPLSLFYPELFALTGVPKRVNILRRNEGDPEDPFDDNYLLATKRRYGEMTEGQGQDTSFTNTDQCDDDVEGCEIPSYSDKEFGNLLSLDQAIIQCIDRCDNDEMKHKMYSCILLTGGGLFPGLENWLQKVLNNSSNMTFTKKPNNVEILCKPKDLDGSMLSWKGGAILSMLDGANDFWISAFEWKKNGVRTLREKAALIW